MWPFIAPLHMRCSRKKWHKFHGSIIFQLYVTQLCVFQQNFQKNCLRDKSQCQSMAIKYSLFSSTVLVVVVVVVVVVLVVVVVVATAAVGVIVVIE